MRTQKTSRKAPNTPALRRNKSGGRESVNRPNLLALPKGYCCLKFTFTCLVPARPA